MVYIRHQRAPSGPKPRGGNLSRHRHHRRRREGDAGHQSQSGERRVDPDDNQLYTWEELRRPWNAKGEKYGMIFMLMNRFLMVNDGE